MSNGSRQLTLLSRSESKISETYQEKENKKKHDHEYDEKISKLLQLTYDYNTTLNIIIGAGNTREDLARHQFRYNIALGGETSTEGDEKGLYAFPFYVPSPEFEQMIDVLGREVKLIAVDISVCADINIRNIIMWMPRLHPNIEMYIPYRNLTTPFGTYFDDIIHRNDKRTIDILKKQFNRAGIIAEFFDNNMDLQYPIAKRGIGGQTDIVTTINYVKLRLRQ